MRQLLNCLAYVITASAGIATWIAIPLVTGEQTVWWSGSYYKVAIPLFALMCGILGFLLPERWWHWGLVTTFAQIFVVVFKWSKDDLLPPTIIFLFLLSLPYLISGFIGERLRQRWGKRRNLKDRIE